ncbi:MAG: DUF5658 family protein [bacterium]|nr:DUF5658 family protein [bacterium]
MNRLGLVFLIICLLDLTGTALGIHFGYLGEANPILNYFLIDWGLSGFILAKLFFVVVPIFVLEIISKYDPGVRRRIRTCYKFLIVAYVFIFIMGNLYQLATA